MRIEIKNCNNIDYTNIEIKDKKLNIKFGANGTGKTTIARSIEYSVIDRINKDNLLKSLMPFKYRNAEDESNKPEVNGIDTISKVAIFNEDYINKYVFLEDEVLKNSFDVFIKTEEYENMMKEIDLLINEVRQLFQADDTLKKLISDSEELIGCFGNAKSGLSASGKIAKGLKSGNKLNNIPEELKDYEEYLNNKDNIKWLKWQMTGNSYLGISCRCPYCTAEMENRKEVVLKVAKEYDSKIIEHLNKILEVFNNLNEYFTEETNSEIQKITHSVVGLSTEQIEYLVEIRRQIERFYKKLTDLEKLNYFSLKEVSKIADELEKYKIDVHYMGHLNSIATNEKIELINSALDKMIIKAGLLQGKIRQQNNNILKRIQQYEREINEFLKCAGYKYNVTIELIENEYKMKLQHEGLESYIQNGKAHLSYGEKNAFALILFMYEVISKSPELVILDDPISSFDKNKKFAIINKLFKGKNSLRQYTVLMITHDFDPIVDMIKHFSKDFNEIPPYASFLENIDGVINEKEIKREDIKTFIEIAKENIELLDDNLNKLIYLRRLYEVNGAKGEAWDLLSNIFHKRMVPITKENSSDEIIERSMTEGEIEKGICEIKKYISDFDYYGEVDKVLNEDLLRRLYESSQNNYEKLQFYRLINNENSDNVVIRKFVNETFHIDNDYLYQLNPCKYDIIPKYIIEECNKDLESSRSTQLI